MKKILASAAMAALILVASPAASFAEGAQFTDAQKKEIETLMHDYLMAHPEVIMDSVDKYRRGAEEESTKAFDEKIKASGDALYNDPSSPVTGNEKGDVTIVEFFDYNCGYCKMAFKDVQTLIDEDKNVRIVFKDIPILSEASRTAARYALAADKQGKYWDFHKALMEKGGANNEDSIKKTAADLGLDMKKLETDADSPEIRAILEKNLELARTIGITGTPGFVIADQALRGHYGIEAMRKAIAEARGKKDEKK
ncbi:MAG TPA: DsbA family protein [Micavibrio sp.]